MKGFVERLAARLLFLIVAAYALGLSIYQPFHNWDAIGYIAAAKSFEQHDIDSVHAFTYAELRSVLPAAQYEDLSRETAPGPGRGGVYRHAVSTDSSAFKEQLPFYQIRPIYTGFIYLLYKAGIDIELATYLISGIAVAVGLMVLYLIAASVLAKPLIFLLPPLTIVFGVLELAKFSTPDGLAFCAVMVAVYLYLKARTNLLLIALTLMLGIRTDLILFSMPLLLALFALDRKNRRKIAFAAFASVAIYLGILAYCKNPGWATFFYCTMVQRCTHPISNPPLLAMHDYVDALVGGTADLFSDRVFILYLLVLAASLYLIRVRARTISFASILTTAPAILLAASLAFVASRFLILPAEWTRAFPAAYVIGTVALLHLVSDHLDASRSRRSEILPIAR